MKQIIKFIDKAIKAFLQIFPLRRRDATINFYKAEMYERSRTKPLPLHRLILTIFSFLGIILTVLLIWFIWKAPQWQASNIVDTKDRITVENATRGTLIQAIGGLFLFVTGYFSWRNLQVTQEKQVTERFAKAVEQLGNENIHVRLGAIYALERIAKDSDKDYWQVMEILTAYVRERAPYPPRKKDYIKNPPLWLTVQNLHQKDKNLSVNENLENATPIKTDIQAVLTVVSRRAKSYRSGELYSIDLSKTTLIGADLSNANLTAANLIGTLLTNTNLVNTKLIGADLINTKLIGAELIGADLSNTNLGGADLSGANLSCANLCNASLYKTDLSNAFILNANFTNAELHEVNFSGAYLTDANLTNADLSDSDLNSSSLDKAKLTYASLFNANLTNSYLSGANLSGTDLSDANLSGAIFWNKKLRIETKNITPEQIKKALFWEKAIYSPEFRKELGLPPEE